MSKQQPRNPFYFLLVLAGIVFTITACGYAVMSVRGGQGLAEPESDHTLLRFLEDHGFTALMIELAVLALATIAAIGTDEFWMRRHQAETGQRANTESTVSETESKE